MRHKDLAMQAIMWMNCCPFKAFLRNKSEIWTTLLHKSLTSPIPFFNNLHYANCSSLQLVVVPFQVYTPIQCERQATAPWASHVLGEITGTCWWYPSLVPSCSTMGALIAKTSRSKMGSALRNGDRATDPSWRPQSMVSPQCPHLSMHTGKLLEFSFIQ